MTSFEVEAIIEIPIGSTLKYEVDKQSGLLTVDRVLNQEIPTNYGFVLNTHADDGDALDIFVLCSEVIQPLCKVNVVVFGAFVCNDDGDEDHKLIGHIRGISASKEEKEDQAAYIEEYLTTYKRGFVVEKFVGAKEAYEIYLKSKL